MHMKGVILDNILSLSEIITTLILSTFSVMKITEFQYVFIKWDVIYSGAAHTRDWISIGSGNDGDNPLPDLLSITPQEQTPWEIDMKYKILL